eukprot:symbB.v1.2.018921.t1/scaffold1517.1/size114154/4
MRRRILCAFVVACSLPGLEPWAFVGLSQRYSVSRDLSRRRAANPTVETEPAEFAEPPELPTAKTWRELRRNRRFDHSPGNWWRTYLLPDQEAQNPKLIQSNLVRVRNLPRLLYILQGDLEKWNGVNLATAWHRLAKFSQASPRGKTRGGSRGNRQQDEQDEQDVQVQP